MFNLGGTVYRIHGTNAPQSIGTHVSSGCIRLTNQDVTDLYSRVNVGTKVIVPPMDRRAENLLGRRG
jgi:lipoprotein-anchoring transpeptidase ErfK/SrfK